MKLFRKRVRHHAVTGLYLTRRSLAAVALDRQRGRKPRLTQAACRDLAGHDQLEKLLYEVAPGGKTPVTLVMPEHHYELLLVDAPRVEPSELRAAVRWKVRNLIDFHIDDAVIDVFEIPGQQNRPQGQAMMYAVAARAREVREYIDLIEGADLDLQVIDITEMAMRNLAAQLDDDVRGVAMLYLDDRHGIITITRQGSLYLSRRVETGIEQLHQEGQAAQQQIALELQRSLDYYDSHFGQPPVASLRVLPGFDTHETLLETLRESFAFQVEAYRAEDVVALDCSLPETHPAELLIALGGALRQEEISL